MTPGLRALASRALEGVSEDMVSWTCLKEHPSSATVWRVEAAGRAAIVKQHRHPRPFAQESRAYRDWLPRLAGDAGRTPPAGDRPPQPAAVTTWARPPSDRLDVPGARPVAAASAPEALAARTPALLAFDLDARALALSLAPGARLSLGTHDPASLAPAHAAAGRLLRDLHALDVADDDPLPLREAVSARVDAWFARARDLLAPAERDGLQRLARGRDAFADVRRVPCHRDFTPDNWLLEGTGLHVLDFEHARLDAPEADLVKLRAEVWPGRPALAAAFLAGRGPLTADAAARLDVLLALHAAATLAWAERHADAAFHALGRRALAVALASA